MNVKLISIQRNDHSYEMAIAFDNAIRVFKAEIEDVSIGEHQIQLAKVEEEFWRTVNFSALIADRMKILLQSLYNQTDVELPFWLGEINT